MGRGWTALVIAGLLAVSCSGTGGGGDAIAGIEARLKGRGMLKTFLLDVADDVRRHDWEALLGRASPPHRYAQVDDMGMGVPQYLAELLGLHMVGNSIKRGEEVTSEDLNRLARIRFTEVDEDLGVLILRGEALLQDGTVLKLEIWVATLGGGHVLTGAVG
ncbi:MAG: hypothetical protein ABIK09_19375 [Pseudomonadota bacterium]